MDARPPGPAPAPTAPAHVPARWLDHLLECIYLAGAAQARCVPLEWPGRRPAAREGEAGASE